MAPDSTGGHAKNTRSDADADHNTTHVGDDVVPAECAADYHDLNHDPDDSGDGPVQGALADLVPLLSAARAARDELTEEGRTVSRDALARRMRRNGYSIRNTRLSELITALRQETTSRNGARPKTPV